MSVNLTHPEGTSAEAWARIATPDGTRWAIAERDATGSIIGTAHRSADGRKGSKKGGQRGLILPWPLDPEAGGNALRPVYVTEGASDAAALLTLGLDAVGVPMAGHCGAMLAELLADRHAVIVADADDAGRRGARTIAEALAERCQSVRVIEPPGGAKDARAAAIAGATREDFENLTRAATRHTPPPPFIDGAPIIRTMAEIERTPVHWLWPGRIPLGRLTLIAGRPGDGKSFVTCDLAARVSKGAAMPDGALCEQGGVILVAAEDDPGDTIRPRLDAHGADVHAIAIIEGVHRRTHAGKPSRVMFTLEDLGPLEAAIAAQANTRLIVIDPIGSYIGGRVDAHRDNEIRAVLSPLADLARTSGVAVLIVAHTRKTAATLADDAVMGSRAFTGLARAVHHVLPDAQDSERRYLLPGKINLAKRAQGLAFRLEGDGQDARVVWLGPVDTTADEVMAALAAGSGRECGATDEAREWLVDALSGGPRHSAEVIRAAERDGIAKRTLDRAKARLGVKSTREGYGSNGEWVWVMPT